MKKYFAIFLLSFLSESTFGQESNGRVNSVVAAENYFASYTKNKGIRDAFLKVSDESTILFRPHPVKAEDFFDKKSSNDSRIREWNPAYAKISKSGDWAFSTGPYSYSSKSDNVITYGQYLSVWKTNNKGVWKLALDIEMQHGKPISEPYLSFIDPKSFRFYRQVPPARLKQREQLILTTDQLFSKTLLENQDYAYNTFIAEDARLLFPGYEPLIGKAKINNFLNSQQIGIETLPAVANRALGSDLAYTYGKAQITKDGKTEQYHYVRIWEAKEGFTWNVLLEIFSPEEK